MDPTDMIDFASDPAFGLDQNMRVTGWNSGAEALLGYTAAETGGMACGQVLQAHYMSGEPLCSILCEGRACITSGSKWNLSACTIRHKNGDMIPTGISSLVLPHEARSKAEGDTVAVIFLHRASDEMAENSTEIPLRVFTLGKFALASFGKGLEVDTWKRKKAVVALKILISQLDRPVHRERLIDWLWPDAGVDNGWARLKVTISYLRAALREAGMQGDIVETNGQSYLVRRASVWVDTDRFEIHVTDAWTALHAGDNDLARRLFEEAESIYRGDLFEDEPYAEWCAVERERLCEIRLEMYAGMARCHTEGGRFLESSRVCRQALALDPCRENFVRILLGNLTAMGRKDWARAHFLSWRKNLQEYYCLEPTPETWASYHDLVVSTLTVESATG